MPETISFNLPTLVRKNTAVSPSRLWVSLVGRGAVLADCPSGDQIDLFLSREWEKHIHEHPDPSRPLSFLAHLNQRKTLSLEPVAISVRKGNKEVNHSIWVHHFLQAGIPYLSFPDFYDETIFLHKPSVPATVKHFIRKKIKAEQPIPGFQEGDYIQQVALKLPLRSSLHGWEHRIKHPPSGSKSPLWEKGKLDLHRLGKNLNLLFPHQLQRAWGRAQLNAEAFQKGVIDLQSPLVLLGEEGSGRHSLVHEMVYRYLSEEFDHRKRTFWLLNPNRVISGMSIVGQWQRRMEALLTYLAKPGDHAEPDILVLDRPLPLVSLGAGKSGYFAMADILIEWIQAKRIKLIVLSNREEWAVIQAQKRRFADSFLQLSLYPLDQKTARPLLLKKRRHMERQGKVFFSIQALEELVALYERHLKPTALPGAIGNLMDRLAEHLPGQSLRASEIRHWFMDQFGVPAAYPAVGREEPLKKFLEARLIGQPEAIDVLGKVIALIQTQLQPAGRPISSLLFVGPTGVGKTQAAKVLSLALYGDDRHLIRFDMNEYGDLSAVNRLIGWSSSGEGLLTAKVRRQPFGVLLLDEIEKAHPSVHNLLLQVLDEGRLTNSQGRTTYFHNLVIIMTSNLGVQEAQSQLGFQKGGSAGEGLFLKAVESFFRPELVNRIEDIVVFQPLQPEHILPIARLQINELLQRDGLIRRTSLLNMSTEALDWLARQGYDAQMGGRALKRTIEKELTVLTADQLLRIPPQTPLILDILLRDKKLQPELHPLHFRPLGDKQFWERLKRLSGQKKVLADLRRRTQHLIRETNQFATQGRSTGALIANETGRDQWALFHHKERLAQLEEELLHFQAGYGRVQPNSMIRFKEASQFEDGRIVPLQSGAPNLLSDPQLLESVQQSQPLAPSLLPPEHVPLLCLVQKVQVAEQMQGDLAAANKSLLLEMHIRKRSGPPKPVLLELLKDQYAAFFVMLDLKFEWLPNHSAFELEGFGLPELLSKEMGYHLFMEPHQNPTLFEIYLTGPGIQKEAEQEFEIIRMYFSNKVILDLGRSCTGFLPLRPEEFLFLL